MFFAKRLPKVIIICGLATAAGCGFGDGDLVNDDLCDTDPQNLIAGPTIALPLEGAIDVLAETLTIEVAKSAQGSANPALVELWLMAGESPIRKVWSHLIEAEGNAFSFGLSEGEFEVGVTGLNANQRYGLRTQSLVDDCSASTWSGYRSFTTDSGASYFFASSTIRTLQLDIPLASYGPIDDEARPPAVPAPTPTNPDRTTRCYPYERPYHSATVRFEGEVFEDSGLRVKGGCGSARTLDEKAAFKSNLSWDNPDTPGCPETRRLHGLKRLTLNNQIQDPSNIHERIAYDFYRRVGVPVPRVAPISLEVNEKDSGVYDPWGLYLNVESIDRLFLSRWFGSNQGMLYEGTYYCDLELDNIPSPGDSDLRCFSKKFDTDECDGAQVDESADPTTFEPLKDFILAYNTVDDNFFYADMSTMVDMNMLVNLMAADVVVNHWDGYMFNRNNYRIYHDVATGLWSFIPTGLDQTFQTRLDQNPFTMGLGGNGEVAYRCIQNEACRDLFAQALERAIGIFEDADYVQVADQIRNEIAPLVASDPRRPTSESAWRDGVFDTIDFIRSRPNQIRAWLSEAGY